MEEKKKGNVGLIILVVILLIACIGMGAFIFINIDKIMVKTTTEATEKKNNQEVDKTDDVEDVEEPTITPADDSKYTEKVYSMNNESIVLFKSGKCVVKNNLEYTAHCTYSIENNTVTITRRATGPNNGSESTYVYNIVQDEAQDEYIELSTDSSQRYKYLK